MTVSLEASQCLMVFVKVVFFLLSSLLYNYFDSSLNELSLSGVGCCWRWIFAGVFCFADDIVLLAPCASAQFAVPMHHHIIIKNNSTDMLQKECSAVLG